MKVLAPFSTGKDSQAAVLWAKEKFKNIEIVFCDTKWEAPESYEHLKYFEKAIGQKITVLTSSKYDGMVDLALKKKRFPSTKARFCTQELKVKPMVDYILSLHDHIIIIDGIRADESVKRSKMESECRYFKYYFEPYETNSMIVDYFNENPPVSLNQKKKFEKAKDRLALGKDDPKFFTYRKKEVFSWCEKYDDSLIRPFFHNTAQDVIDFSLDRGFKINPRYYRGRSRVGCDPCIMENIPSITMMVKDSPEAVQKIKDAEKFVGHSFFPPDKIPKRYRKQTAPNGKKYALMEDVERYVLDSNATSDMFEHEPMFACRSVYKICE